MGSGGRRPGAGRPKLEAGEGRCESIRVKVTQTEKAEALRKAGESPLSTWIRRLMRDA